MRVALVLLMAIWLVACTSQLALAPKTHLAIRPASFIAQVGWTEMMIKNTQQKIYLSESAIITTQDIASAEATFTEEGMPIVSIKLTTAGKQKLALATERYVNQPIGIVVNGELLSAPVIRERISSGMVWISGIASAQEAKVIADGLNQ